MSCEHPLWEEGGMGVIISQAATVQEEQIMLSQSFSIV